MLALLNQYHYTMIFKDKDRTFLSALNSIRNQKEIGNIHVLLGKLRTVNQNWNAETLSLLFVLYYYYHYLLELPPLFSNCRWHYTFGFIVELSIKQKAEQITPFYVYKNLLKSQLPHPTVFLSIAIKIIAGISWPYLAENFKNGSEKKSKLFVRQSKTSGLISRNYDTGRKLAVRSLKIYFLFHFAVVLL